MYKGNRIIGVIPARAGSKRLPRKNILNFCGKPLIAWTIGEAIKSRYLDDVIVSTDDSAIARISKAHGVSAPFIRPARLASGKAKTVDVLIHAINWLERRGRLYDVVVLLQPTSPLRSASDIDRAIELLFKGSPSAVVSVCRTEHNPSWSGVLQEDGSMEAFRRLGIKTGQDNTVFYRLNGAVYAISSDNLRKKKSFFSGKTFAYIMPKERSVDIDDKLDFDFAEFLAKKSGRL